MAIIQPQPGILDIQPYVGGKAQLGGVQDVLKLSSNENPLGPSPRAQEAYTAAAQSLHRYPSDSHAALRLAISVVHNLDADQIICGAGSDEIIALLCQAYAGPGDQVVHCQHGFAMHRISALAAGATPVEAPEKDRCADVQSILDVCTARTRLVFLANPANPTGTMLGGNEIARLADGLPDHTLLVLDGAYVEYIEGHDGGAALIAQRDNVVMTRTFSKIYGLGGLRVGWGYGPAHVIDVLNRVRGPFNVSAPALAAAEAAVRDVDWTAHCRTENAKWRAWLAAALAEEGVPSDTSAANFVLARFADADEAAAANAHLEAAGILVRSVASYQLPQALRITVADEAGCKRVVSEIRAFKRQSA